MPQSEATSRGRLRKSPTAQPHEQCDAVSARQRQHKAAAIKELLQKTYSNKKLPSIPRFDISDVPRSTTLHCDYTGPLYLPWAPDELKGIPYRHGTDRYRHILQIERRGVNRRTHGQPEQLNISSRSFTVRPADRVGVGFSEGSQSRGASNPDCQTPHYCD